MMGPKLITCNKHIAVWQNPKGWTQEEVNICTQYYQLQAQKLGLKLAHYMREFQ